MRRTLAVLPFAASIVLAASAHAATFVVNDTVDRVDAHPGDGACADALGKCTLRAAVMESNALAGADEITVPAGVYLLAIAGANEDAAASGDLDLAGEVTITGAGVGVTVIDGASRDRVFDILPGANAKLSKLTIRRGEASTSGGGVLNHGDATLSAVLVVANRAQGTATPGTGLGGGVHNLGTLAIVGSTVSANVSAPMDQILCCFWCADDPFTCGCGVDPVCGVWAEGEAADILNDGVLAVENSTITREATGADPDLPCTPSATRVCKPPVLVRAGTASFLSATVTDRVGGAGAMQARNSVFADACDAPVLSLGHNLESGASCGFTAPGDLQNTDPKLGPLQQVAVGKPAVYPLLAGSPAIDAADAAFCPVTDETGFPRPAACDIGAFEAGGSPCLGAGGCPPFTFVVNSTRDAPDLTARDGVCDTGLPLAGPHPECTLRAAIQQANAIGGPDRIVLGAGTYAISIPGRDEDDAATGDLDIRDDLTIEGAGQARTVIDGAGIDRVLEVGSLQPVLIPGPPQPEVTLQVALRGLTVRGGRVAGGGGGVYSPEGALTLEDVTVEDNEVEPLDYRDPFCDLGGGPDCLVSRPGNNSA